MRIATTIPITEARKRLFEIARAVQKPEVQYTLTEHGKPTVTVLSAKAFEKLSQGESASRRDVRRGERLMYAGMPGQKLPFLMPQTMPQMMPLPQMVRETSPHTYGADMASNSAYYAKELAKAWLYVSLVETYGYPNDLIDIGRWVQIGGEGSRMYIEADLIVDDRAHDRLIIAAVAGGPWYEERREAAIEELFALCSALGDRREVYLVYYTRAATAPERKRAGKRDRSTERWVIIDGVCSASRDEWTTARTPSLKALPKFAV